MFDGVGLFGDSFCNNFTNAGTIINTDIKKKEIIGVLEDKDLWVNRLHEIFDFNYIDNLSVGGCSNFIIYKNLINNITKYDYYIIYLTVRYRLNFFKDGENLEDAETLTPSSDVLAPLYKKVYYTLSDAYIEEYTNILIDSMIYNLKKHNKEYIIFSGSSSILRDDITPFDIGNYCHSQKHNLEKYGDIPDISPNHLSKAGNEFILNKLKVIFNDRFK